MIIAIDVETTGLDPWKDRLLGLSVAQEVNGKLTATYYPYETGVSIFPWPRKLLEDSSVTKIGHNLRFDIKFLVLNGFIVNGPWEDTKLLAQLVNENQDLSLKPLSIKYIGKHALNAKQDLDSHLAQLKLKINNLGDPRVDQKLVARYCCEDTLNTFTLFKLLEAEAKTQGVWEYYKEEMISLEPVLLDMELRGNRIDLDKLAEADRELTRIIAEKELAINTMTVDEREKICDEMWENARNKVTEKNRHKIQRPVFNWNSGKQKTKLLYEYLGLGQFCSEVTKKGSPALDRKTLSALELPEGKLKNVVDAQIELQSYTKMKSAYVCGEAKKNKRPSGIKDRLIDGRIHGEYYQASKEEDYRDQDSGGTVTGRLSHRNPNLGNLPRSAKGNVDYWRGTFVKDLFIPDPGYTFIHGDYSQIELRVAAHLSKDSAFISAFNNNLDPHQQIAEQLNILRQQGKTVNFLLIYFGSAWRLAYELGWKPKQQQEKLNEAERIRNGFFMQHPELLNWIFNQQAELKSKGYVKSMFGRIRRLPEVWSPDKKKREHAIKQGGNFLISSPAASITKRAMIELHKRNFKLVNQVHDSITATCLLEEAENKLKEMQDVMVNIVKLSIPLKVDIKIIRTFKD